MQVLQFRIQTFFALTIDLPSDLIGHFIEQLGQVFHLGFDFAVELDLTLFHAVELFSGVAQAVGGIAKSRQRGIQFNHALTHCQRQRIELTNVLL